MKFDAIASVESCYANAADDDAWLAGILDGLAAFDQGPGLYAQMFHWAPDGAWVLERSVIKGPFSAEGIAEAKARNVVMPREILHRIYAPGTTYVLDRAPELRKLGEDVFRKAGIEDVLGVIVTEPDGGSVLVALPLRARKRHLPPLTMHQMTLLGAHVRSGQRLRGSFRAGLEVEPPDAVLDPEGRLLDASGDAKDPGARQSLADGVRRMERARGRLRRTDPDEALQLWQGLVSGKWSLVDAYESDGKRYLLARRNEPSIRDPAALTSRERAVLAFAAMGHPNKYIAYLLGLPGSTVSRNLDAAQTKLKIDSRAELIRRFAPLVRPQEHPPS